MGFLCRGAAAAFALPLIEALAAAGHGARNDTVADKSAKTAAVAKALAMLEDLRDKVTKAGEEESKTYSTFACWCKDTTAAKADAISTVTDEKDTVTADIQALAAKRDAKDGIIQDSIQNMGLHEQDMHSARQERRGQLLQFEADSADLKAAMAGLDGAIRMLKATKTSVSFVQLKTSSPELRKAIAMADALGLGGSSISRLSSFLQQAPDGGIEEYSFSSGSIISMLEGLQTKFRDQRTAVDQAEVASIQQFDLLIQDRTAQVKTEQDNMDGAKKEKAQVIADIASASERLSTAAATLIDDKEYATKLAGMCSAKAQTYDKRLQIRTDELQALTQAISTVQAGLDQNAFRSVIRFTQAGVSLRLAKAIARDSTAMSAIEASVEEAERPAAPPAALLATARRHRTLISAAARAVPAAGGDAGRNAVESLLRVKGVQLRSTLLTALATKIAEDPFAKVKQLIQDLVERLQQQATSEANQKGWCDKSIADAEQRRGYAMKEVQSLNDRQGVLVALQEQLNIELQDLANKTQDIRDGKVEAEHLRSVEKAESNQAIQESQYALGALNEIIDILQKFYKSAENQAKESLIQQANTTRQGPVADAPEAGFESGEAYAGAGSGATGVIAMLEVMRSDFERTVSETEASEKQAEQDHLEFMTESEKTRVATEQVTKAKNAQINSIFREVDASKQSLSAEMAKVTASIKELLALHPACNDSGASYEDRSLRRNDEVEALNKALCILGAFDDHGPTGVSAAAC